MTAIVYSSTYGSTRRYSEVLAAELRAPLFRLDDAPPIDSFPFNAAIVLAPNYAGQFAGLDYAAELARQAIPVAFAAVGMTDPQVARRKDPVGSALGDLADEVPRFYLPGRLFYSELSRVHRAALWTVTRVLKQKPSRTPVEDAMIDGYGKDLDYVDVELVRPLVNWRLSHESE